MMERDKGKGIGEGSCDPFFTAHYVKLGLEAGTDGGVFVYDPNGTNAFLTGGNSKNANAIWLSNWLEALGRAKASGGRVIQIIVPGGKDVTEDNPEGLSHMQKAEALMASMWGVEVVKLDCREVKWHAGYDEFEKMAGWKELKFITIDTDRDGFITRAEVAAYHLEQGGEKEDEVNKLFDKHDADKDGKLSQKEFCAAFGELRDLE